MELKQTVDDILINGKSILNNKYKETRKRICRFKGSNDLSDKDIIEYLAVEIEDYRNKIEKLEEYIDKLKEKQIEDTRLEDKDVIEITSTTQYADGKPISTTMKYKYKKTINQDIECERNIYSCGIDGGDKDYQVTSYYDNNGNLIKEEIKSI